MANRRKIILMVVITCVLGTYFFSNISEKFRISNEAVLIKTPNVTSTIITSSVSSAVFDTVTSTTSASKSAITISNRRTIFFLETSNNTNLNCRQSCAVESAAKSNPNMDVTLYHVSPELNLNDTLLKILSEMANVKLKYLRTDTFFDGSPLQDWNLAGEWKQSPYRINHVSDAVRLLVLWKFGGIYLDSDVVVLKSLEDLVNCSGLQFENEMANGVLAFDKHHPFLYKCLEEFNVTYDANSWAGNGPLLLARVLMRECVGVHNLSEVSREKCKGVKLFPPQAFYAIPYPSWRLFFDSKNANSTMRQWGNSYLIHVWNKLSKNATIKIGSYQPYELAAIKYCPEIHNICKKGDSF